MDHTGWVGTYQQYFDWYQGHSPQGDEHYERAAIEAARSWHAAWPVSPDVSDDASMFKCV